MATPAYADLPPTIRTRLGIRRDEKNLLVRLVLRHHTRTLSDRDANALRDRAYAGLHRGAVHEWALE